MVTKENYIPFETIEKEWMKDPEFCKVCEEVSKEYELLDRMLAARKRAKMSQADVAKKMNTSRSAVCRIEGAEIANTHSPSIATLRRYAEAVGCRLDIRFIKQRKSHAQP